MLVPVRFLRHWGAYNAGEVAGFGPSFAKRIVAEGAGELLLLADLDKIAKQEKEAAKAELDQERKRRISLSNGAYDAMVQRLDPKKDSARIGALVAEKEKMAKLIRETRHF